MPTRSFITSPFGIPIAASLAWQGAPAYTLERAVATDPWKFAGTGLRWPGDPLTRSGNNYVAGDFAIGMPDWEVTEVLFGFPAFGCNSSQEVACPNGYTIEGIATRADNGQRTPGLMNGASDPIVIDPSVSGYEGGDVIRFTPAAPIPAGVTQVFSFAQYIPDGLYPRNRATGAATTSIFGGAVKDERSEGGTSSKLSTLSGSTNYANVNAGFVAPCFMLVKGHGQEQSIFCFGDSIGYGVAGSSNNAQFNSRHEFGYLSLGLDDAVGSTRKTYFNGCIPGWGFDSTDTTGSHGNSTASSRQLALLARARSFNGSLPIADEIICQHGTNSVGIGQTAMRTSYRAAMAIWRAAIGKADATAAAIEMLQLTSSTDGFATNANQSVSAPNTYPTGARWLINADIGGADGLGDASANLRADGTFQHSIAPWRISADDLASERDKFEPRAFSTTTAASWNATSDSTISLTAAPPVGESLVITGGGNTANIAILTVTGSGPYTCTYIKNSGTATFASGSAVQAAWCGDGVHPSPLAHHEYSQAIIDYKVARGWVPPDSAAAISASSISGTAENGQVLTANATVTGFPVPTVTYQWQKNGTNISGQTSQTITLDGSGMGLVDGDTISCEITATNTGGSATAEPTIAYVNALGPSLLDTGDFTAGGTAAYREILDADSFRLCRDGSAFGTFQATLPATGSYRIRGTLSDYDGAIGGITSRQLEIRDTFTVKNTITAAGAFDVTISFATTTILFQYGAVGEGGRVDDFHIEAA